MKGFTIQQNEDIRKELKKYGISYNELLPYLTNFSHTTRISEELAKPLSEYRKKEYLLAIEKIRQEKIRRLQSD